MRRGLPLFVLVLLPAACTSSGSDDSVERGGQLTVTRSRSGSSETLTAVAAFFTPPGPPEPAWPAPGACALATPDATPSPSPSGTPIQWRDAGPHVELQGAATLVLPKYEAGGAISYLAAPTSADVLPLGATFDLVLAGSTAPNGLPAKTIEDALELPAAIALTAPNFAQGPIALSGTALGISWDASGGADEVLVSVLVTSTAGGVATLRCTTDDDGEFAIPAEDLAALPTGSGLVGVTRAARRVAPLEGNVDLVGTGVAIESGAILVP